MYKNWYFLCKKFIANLHKNFACFSVFNSPGISGVRILAGVCSRYFRRLFADGATKSVAAGKPPTSFLPANVPATQRIVASCSQVLIPQYRGRVDFTSRRRSGMGKQRVDYAEEVGGNGQHTIIREKKRERERSGYGLSVYERARVRPPRSAAFNDQLRELRVIN